MQDVALVSQRQVTFSPRIADIERLLRRNSIALGIVLPSLWFIPFLLNMARLNTDFRSLVDDLLLYALALIACVGWGWLWHRLVWSVYMRLEQRNWRIGALLSRYFALHLALGTTTAGVFTGVIFLLSRAFGGEGVLIVFVLRWAITVYTMGFHAVLHPAFMRYALRWG